MPRFTPHSEKTKQKIREAHIGKKMGKCFAQKCSKMMSGKIGENTPHWKGGIPKCIECSKQLGSYTAKRCKLCSGKRLGKLKRGNKSHLWKGGVTNILQKIRGCFEYKIWRKLVYERDNYQCVLCGDNSGGNLEADHIIRLVDIVNRFNIKSLDSAISCSDLWNIDNGRTLCVECHINTPTYGWVGQQLFNKLNIKCQ